MAKVMQWPGYRALYTTGQIAKVCQVAPRTVSKWIDSGTLRGFRIPNSEDRRVVHADLVTFMRRHRLDSLCPELFTDRPSLLAVGVPQVLRDRLASFSGCNCTAVEGIFDAGMAVAASLPVAAVVCFGAMGRSEGVSLGRCLTGRKVSCAALVGDDGAGEAEALEAGYCLAARPPWSAVAILESCGLAVREPEGQPCP